MEKLLEQIKLIASRVYVRFLSATRATHSFKIPELKPKTIHIQNRKSFVFLIFILTLIFALYMLAVRAPHNFPQGVLIELESGKSLQELAQILQQEDVVQSATLLSAIIRLRGSASNVHAGDYIFHGRKNVFAVARIITTGAFGLEPVRITIPEGSTVRDMAQLYNKKMLRFDEEKFLQKALPLEGYLFPDTYFFLPNTKESEIVRVMHNNFERKISEFEEVIKESGKTLEEIVIMASIVEKEAKIHNDRKMIAGVLWNRININMPLQVDATFVYTHNKGSSQITMAELLNDTNAYNTYQHLGLPPGPIAAPGLGALKATIYPTENTYVFYLADKYGKTYFSKTYEEHMQKRAKYINF